MKLIKDVSISGNSKQRRKFVREFNKKNLPILIIKRATKETRATIYKSEARNNSYKIAGQYDLFKKEN